MLWKSVILIFVYYTTTDLSIGHFSRRGSCEENVLLLDNKNPTKLPHYTHWRQHFRTSNLQIGYVVNHLLFTCEKCSRSSRGHPPLCRNFLTAYLSFSVSRIYLRSLRRESYSPRTSLLLINSKIKPSRIKFCLQ